MGMDVEGYEELRAVLEGAYDQAARGKGKERHAGGQVYTRQPILMIPALIADETDDSLRYQAIKKLTESKRLPTERAIAECYGAIIYTATMIMRMKDRLLPVQDTVAPSRPRVSRKRRAA